MSISGTRSGAGPYLIFVGIFFQTYIREGLIDIRSGTRSMPSSPGVRPETDPMSVSGMFQHPARAFL